ncbi:MAG: response regulator transcription factor [Candidatus Margulisbacteria bacterium]|nr:response regulator transcription factor [Candidatus Margulisiibacteriota bacterium]MBU1616773.1 response regulator transcription factor [Candidatus Margulisiibacteriota bacterium]
MNKGARVLIIDDERSIRKLLDVYLSTQGFAVCPAKTGKEGLLLFNSFRPDIVILDLHLPDITGDEVLAQIKKRASVPVIILTVKNADSDKIALLDAGADDYLTKPFSPDELAARIRVALRHSLNLKEEPIFRHGRIKIDFSLRGLEIDSEPVKLTNTEFDLLKALVQNTGKIVTQKQLLKEIWGPESTTQTHYLRIYFSQLRKKLDKYKLSNIILTEPGVGYRLDLQNTN